jgi:OOP family OmpA-OmpF porin
MPISQIILRRTAVVLLLIFSVAAQAEETSGLTISPMNGATGFDDDTDNDLHWSLGLGYQFNNPWAVEFVYSDVNTEDDRTGVDLDFTRWHVDGLYHLNQRGAFRPYLAFGAGRGEYDFSSGTRDTDTLLNVGMGVKYTLAKNTSLRSELKLFEGNDFDAAKYAFSVGLHHVFFAKTAPLIQKAKDSDHDGFLDEIDQCPATPRGEAVDTRGCELDSDKDGILDKNDNCPDTRNRKAKIDEHECYVLITETVTTELDVKFDTDSDRSRPEHKQKVEHVFKFMQSYPLTKVTIEGHTDSKGKSEYNQSLSERRAKTIAEMLVKDFGLSESRVSRKGHGETRPIADNLTAAGRQKNRRAVGKIEASIQKVEEKIEEKIEEKN